MNIRCFAALALLAVLPATASAQALPRFAASSELFELVGVVDGRQLIVYLDRFADNAPVKGATLKLEVGGRQVALAERAAGEFEGSLSADLATGVTPVTATIVAGTENDLLAADLLRAPASEPHVHAIDWRRAAAGATGALLLLATLVWSIRRRAGAAA